MTTAPTTAEAVSLLQMADRHEAWAVAARAEFRADVAAAHVRKAARYRAAAARA